MQDAQALALRRAALTVAAIAATVGAHHAATGVTSLYDGTPALWAGFVAVAVLVGHRTRAYRPRAPRAVLGAVVAAQLAAHAVLVHAPWALGLAGHPGAAPTVSASAVVAHVAAALLLTVLLTGVEATLAALCAARARLAAALGDRCRRPGGPCHRAHPDDSRRGPSRGVARARTSRGPPRPVAT